MCPELISLCDKLMFFLKPDECKLMKMMSCNINKNIAKNIIISQLEVGLNAIHLIYSN